MTFPVTTEFKERQTDKDAANQVLEDIEGSAPQIQSRSAEMEITGRIPIDLIKSLKAIGVFRMFVPRSPLLLLLIPAIFVGIATGAVDEIVRVANTGRQQFRAATPMRDSELFQAELGRIEADLNAARACLQVQVASHWNHALNGTLKREPFFTQTLRTAASVGITCVRVATDCFALGGSRAVYESSALQLRLRDLLVGSQHFAAQKRQYVTSGKLLLETDPA